jgi:hypothetical protein
MTGKVVNGCTVLNYKWIAMNGSSPVFGAILVDDGEEKKVYCGPGTGVSEERDIHYILQTGSKMHPESWISFLKGALDDNTGA